MHYPVTARAREFILHVETTLRQYSPHKHTLCNLPHRHTSLLRQFSIHYVYTQRHQLFTSCYYRTVVQYCYCDRFLRYLNNIKKRLHFFILY